MADPEPRTVVTIDLLRFACALLVLGYHYAAAFWTVPDARVAFALQGVGAVAPVAIARAGQVGVELFFVISGVVIVRSAATARWTGFLRRRALRLVPAAWLCASVTAAMLAAGGQADAALAAAWFRSVRFWPVGAQIDGSYWTLGVECAFYLLVALAAGHARRIAMLGWALALTSAVFWATGFALGDQAGPLVTNQAAILLLLPHGCCFAAGIAIATRRRSLLMLAAATGMVEIWAHIDGWRMTGALTAAEAIFAGGVVALLLAPRWQRWLELRIAPGVARSIGLTTYPLYLLHQVAGAALIGGLVRGGAPLGLAVALTVVAMLAGAWVMATRVEPALRAALAEALTPRRGLARDSLRSASPPAG